MLYTNLVCWLHLVLHFMVIWTVHYNAQKFHTSGSTDVLVRAAAGCI